MKIKVLINYGGRDTRERRILPGEYDIDDPALFGVGRGLVERGQAMMLADGIESSGVIEVEGKLVKEAGEGWSTSGEPQSTVSKIISPSLIEPDTPPTMDNTKQEIQEWLDDHGIDFSLSMNKSKLLDLIPDSYYDLED